MIPTTLSKPKVWLPAQFILVMKLTILLLIVAFLQVSAEGYSQKITLNKKEVSLKEILQSIEDQTGYVFFYKASDLPAKQISIRVKDASIEEALNACFKGYPLTYKIVKRNIVIRRSPEPPGRRRSFRRPVPALADTVRGRVTDTTGAPLPGVTVQIKGSTRGISTDESGTFSLEAGEDDVLIFRYIGFATREIPVSAAAAGPLHIILREDVAGLDEIVVVGYGTQKKGDITGSVARVRMDETADLPNYNMLQSLQGKVPGLNITSPDRPGEVPGLSVRGTNSISAGNSPLIVVDGIIYKGNLSDFNPNDIATIDILKDASAAAVYGSRAANGVLLITTKSGTTDKPQFQFSTYHGIQKPDRLIDVLDGPGYLQKVLDYREATGLEADPANIDEYLTVVEAENRRNGLTIDWMDRTIQTGVIGNYHLNVSGKTPHTNYYISGTYFTNEGILVNDDFDRITLNLNLTNSITDWYSVSIKSMFSSQDRSGREADLDQAYRQSPYGSFYDENGPGGLNLYPVGDTQGTHPLANTLIENKNIRTSLWGLFSHNLKVPFIPGLTWTLNASANLRNRGINEFLDNASSSQGRVENGIGTKEETKNLDWTIDNILNYRTILHGVHSLDATFLYSRESSREDVSRMRGNNFFTQILGYNNLGMAQVQRIESNYEDQNSVAYMGRVNYGYDDRYAVTFTVRRDGFSGFSQNNKYATFPSVAFAWTVTNEEFLKNASWLNYLKLRLSYGKNGNQAIGRYQSLARMGSNNYVFGNTSVETINVTSMANTELTWETTTNRNIGIDFSILDERINGSVDVYTSTTEDILLRKALPETSGFSEILSNVGQVHNHGVEFSLNSVNLKKTRLSWESGFVFMLNRNRIDKLTGQDANGDGIEDDDIGNRWFIGESLESVFGYQTDGIYQLDESGIPPGFQPGDFRIADTNNDGEITPEDRTILGNTLPNYSFSISNRVRYRNFSLYVLVHSIQGGKGYYVGNNNNTRNVNAPYTTFSERFNVPDVPYWTPSRPSSDYPRINYNPPLPHPILEDRSFVRIQDVSLSYDFNTAFLDKMRVNGLRLYVSAKNLHTFTSWTGYDPENATTIRGFPFLRTYTLGVDLKF